MRVCIFRLAVNGGSVGASVCSDLCCLCDSRHMAAIWEKMLPFLFLFQIFSRTLVEVLEYFGSRKGNAVY